MSIRTRGIASLLAAACSAAGPRSAAAEPTVTIPQVGLGAELKIKSDTPTVSFGFDLVADLKEEVKGVSVELTTFSDSEGKTFPAEWTVGDLGKALPQDLKAGTRIRVQVTATFDLPGNYKSHVTLVYDGKRHDAANLVVERVRRALNVRIDPIAAVRRRTWWFSEAKSRVRFVLEETAGLPATIEPPILQNLVRKEGDSTDSQIRAKSWRVVEDAGRAKAPAPARSAPLPLGFRPPQSRAYVLEIEGLEAAGKYEGTLRISSGDAAPLDQVFTIFVREHWGIATLFIAIGAVAVWVVRTLTSTVRPRLLRKRQLLVQEARLETFVKEKKPNAASKALIEALGKMRHRIFAVYAGEPQAIWDERLKQFTARVSLVPLWAQVSAFVASEDAGPDKIKHEATLEEAAGVLRDDDSSLEAIKTQESALKAIKTQSAAMDATLAGDAPMPVPDLAREDERLRRQVNLIDVGIDVFLLGVSVLLGIQTLWQPNAIWGGFGDYVAAILWGMGLQGFAFAGISGLRERLFPVR